MNYTKSNLRTDVVLKGLFRGIIRQIKYIHSADPENVSKIIIDRAGSEWDLKELKLWVRAIGDYKGVRNTPEFLSISKEYKNLKNLPSCYSLQKLRLLLTIKPINVLFTAFLTEESIEWIINYSETMSNNKEAYKEGAILLKEMWKKPSKEADKSSESG